MSRRPTSLTRGWVVAGVLIFITGAALRLPHLGGFLTPDEQRIWTSLTAEFMAALLRGDWSATATSGYPGVTTTWAGALGLALQWLLARPADVSSLAGMADALLADPQRMDMLPWLRLGVAFFSLAGLAIIWLLAIRLLGTSAGMLGAGLMVFDAFLLAHTRVLNTDPLLAVFLTTSWLAVLLALREEKRRYWLLAGASFGLALLAKSPALALAPLVVVWILWKQHKRHKAWRATLKASLGNLLWLAASALATALILWPALWTAPVPTLERVWTFSAVLAETGHELGNYWLGEPVSGPGALFYPAVVLWRTTPVTLVGLLLALGALLVLVWARWRARSQSSLNYSPHVSSGRYETVIGLLAYVLWFGLVMSLSPKKFDRYLLPVFPAIDLLAAWGIVSLLIRSPARRQSAAANLLPSSKGTGPTYAVILGALVLVLQGWFSLAHLPTYLTAYNPLVGGIRTAQQVMLVGWGEGMEEAAHYLNQQDLASHQRAAGAWYGHNVFGPFFAGQSYDLYYDVPTATDLYIQDVDYVVTYINQVQRGLLDPSVASNLDTPVMTNYSHGVPLAQVYTWPKPFSHTTQRDMAPGLRLLGWEVGDDASADGNLPITLFWDSVRLLTAAAEVPPIHGWMKDSAGEVWATAAAKVNSTPENRQPGWLDTQVTAQIIRLEPPIGLPAGPYRIEMAPENAEGLALGELAIASTNLADLPASELATLDSRATFDDAVVLLEQGIARNGDQLTVDLLWAAVASPPAGVKFFLHLVDDEEKIVAQHDGTLAAAPGQSIASWQRDDVVRQRASLMLPPGGPSDLRLYLGLYHPDTGQRLPITVAGQLELDDRLSLTGLDSPVD